MLIDDKKEKQDEEFRKLISHSKKVLRITEEELWDTGKTLDSGAFGKIYKGEYRGHRVAIKCLNPKNRLSNYRELICLMECHCPNIVGIIGAGPSPAKKCLMFIVMEFARNSSLHHLRSARFDKRIGNPWQVEYAMSHAFLWFLHAANGLEYLHEHCDPPKIHRDIKPGNMLLFDDCRLLKLCDFGTARDEDVSLTSHQGAIRYMAPEVFEPGTNGKPNRYDRSVDIYSLCASFWEVFTRADYPRYYQPIEGCPMMVQKLLRRGLSKKVEQRPKIRDIVRFLEFVVKKISPLPPARCNLEFPPTELDEDESTVTVSANNFTEPN
ncbi:unnamed protein product [Dibothriocephalus latus]|uniref:Protein kinase domain-containing protein n=1 Tax=Dibothriocephalus latus TaxID=60516 RepID=A0A3P7LRQ8_DIBLA|nr:unnamed protein product [Dibothriocephalus latus]